MQAELLRSQLDHAKARLSFSAAESKQTPVSPADSLVVKRKGLEQVHQLLEKIGQSFLP